MKLTFDIERLQLPVSVALQQLLIKQLDSNRDITNGCTALTFNFRDISYSAQMGGWHPVEIRIYRKGECWCFDYITDFSYQGLAHPELVKDIDFDFSSGVAYLLHQGEIPLQEITEFYQLWESNFIEYVQMECFDEINMTSDC